MTDQPKVSAEGLLQRIENYPFESQGGDLRNCVEWIELKRIILTATQPAATLLDREWVEQHAKGIKKLMDEGMSKPDAWKLLELCRVWLHGSADTPITCEHCGGSGDEPHTSDATCSYCHGKGYVCGLCKTTKRVAITASQPAAAGTRMAVSEPTQEMKDEVVRAFYGHTEGFSAAIWHCAYLAAKGVLAAAHSCEPTDAQRASYDPLQDEPL